MATPATTGQLRTTVSEMKVGDYIKVGSLNGGSWLLNNGTTELPTAGIPYANSFANYYFYMIKVARGLLIADRVTQNTGSWDSFNTNKLIQGVPWDSGNLIPVMTSNAAPSGVASASNIYAAANDAYKAFDGSVSTLWATGTASLPHTLSYEFPSSKLITAYSITPASDLAGRAAQSPKNFNLEAWDGSNWVVLDERVGVINWTIGVTKTFLFLNKTSYSKFRLQIFSNNNGDAPVSIGEFKLMEMTGIFRSLTGGVAYADANGNISTTDQSKGAWPTNNEWDKYIVNFPVGKIQTGKTLDDVFHWSGVFTWTQDTPALALAAATIRISRSNTTAIRLMFVASSSAGATYGFRPVLEYKEV
ncbi:discoidin domain-containing protein [Paenibacillus sp. FSL E2-0178]|uniref:discoidin domain-containing protein n=1 Tax=Paenibacillus sp. FSL E2-0178 TaxID=2921361 RepID=UPI0031594759